MLAALASKALQMLTAPLAGLLAFVFTFLSNIIYSPGIMDLPTPPDDFTPVMRFTVTSDVHLNGQEGQVEAQRLAQMLQTSKRISSEDSVYDKLDAAAFVGDLCDKGTPETMRQFVDICNDNLYEGTELLAVMGNHEFMHDRPNTIESWKRSTDMDYRFHEVINGFHFIGMSPDNEGRGYTLDNRLWLAEQLKLAENDNPDYPIFVFQHHHIWGTVYGSLNWGNVDLTAILAQFPQVIDFSGHSHYPINDPASIWQGSFTALGTGTLSYFEMEYFPFTGGQFPEGYRQAAQMYVVEADIKGATRIRGYDILGDCFIGETYYIATPADKSTFAYGLRNRLAKSQAPVFDKGAKLSAVKGEEGNYILDFPNAQDNFLVRQYQVTVSEVSGRLVYSATHLSGYYLSPQPERQVIDIGELESGKTYVASVIAANAYYMPSHPLLLSFTAQ
ncbi:MAG: hypothetical protein GX345_03575 [Clostridiales bacterium]|nr:hypothetical protein [Clostridiales bacterium]